MKKISHYVIEEQIGSGKYGIVFKGCDLNTNKRVAIKLIRKALLNKSVKRELLISEIKVMKKLQKVDCKHIIKFLEYVETPRNCYIIMEFCDGGDLKQYLNKNRLDEKNSVIKFKQILEGMKVLFDNNIIHRDLKTANIFIHEEQLKIGDFGFSTEGMPQMIKLGTPLYMAPELLQGENYTTKVDVWALGVILYQMIFADFPYKASSEEKLKEVTKIPIDFQKLNKNVSKSTQQILKRMLEPDQTKRISMEELIKIELFNSDQYQQIPMDHSYNNANLFAKKNSQDLQGESTKDSENQAKSFSPQFDEQSIYSTLAALFYQDTNYCQ